MQLQRAKIVAYLIESCPPPLCFYSFVFLSTFSTDDIISCQLRFVSLRPVAVVLRAIAAVAVDVVAVEVVAVAAEVTAAIAQQVVLGVAVIVVFV